MPAPQGYTLSKQALDELSRLNRRVIQLEHSFNMVRRRRHIFQPAASGPSQSAIWLADLIPGIAVGTYYETSLLWDHSGSETDSLGLPAAKTGKLVSLAITWRGISDHTAGAVSFKVYNATTAIYTGSPNPDAIGAASGIKAAVGGSLAVTLSDKLVVAVAGAINAGTINGIIHADWYIE